MTSRKKKEDTEDSSPSVYKHAELLSKIGKSITSSLSVEKIIETVYKNVNTLMDASVFSIGIYDKDGDQLIFKGGKEKGKTYATHAISVANDNELATWCFTNKKKIVINNLEHEYSAYIKKNMAPVVGAMTKSILYLPLVAKRKTIGVITCQSFKNDAYSTYHINVLQNIAIYTSVALENARLYADMEAIIQQRTEELQNSQESIKILSEIGRQLTSTLDFDTIFNKLHKNVKQLMSADVFGVRILHPERNCIEYKFEMERDKRHPSLEVSMDNDDNPSVWCVKNKKEIFINEILKEHKRYTKKIELPAGEMPHSAIFYPLLLGNKRILGVITVQSFSKNAYTKYHLDILKTLSSYTAIALENAGIYEGLEDKVKERTKELQEKNLELERLSIVASETDNYVIISDKDDRIEWVNAGFTRITDFVLKDVIGKTPAEVLRGIGTYKSDERVIDRGIKAKEPFTTEILNYKKNGDPVWLHLNVTPILNKKKEITRYVALGSDITKLKLSEKEISSQNLIIAKKNKDITSSIRYAKRIQEAILPLKTEVYKYLKQTFIFYKPKDIVSGDFYWFSSVEHNGGRLDLMAAVDCTGHGVPGAFMSLIGNNLLNHIVNTRKEYRPDKILELMHNGIQKSLHTGGDSPDGMEVALCVIDQKNKVLEYAGAGRSLVSFEKGKLKIYPGGLLPLGMGLKNSSSADKIQNRFGKTTIQFNKGDTFYLYSDGYCDQFGGTQGRKFMTERFLELLKGVQGKTMKQQERILEKNIETWRGKLPQVDDILVIGLKV